MHPNTINLIFWDNFYIIRFTGKDYVDEKDLTYASFFKQATISGFLRGEKLIQMESRNVIHLDP